MPGIQSKITRYAKENRIKQGENSTEAFLELIQMLELTEKDTEEIMMNVFNMLKWIYVKA